MWYVVAMGYLFVTIMFAVAQPSLARVVIYLLFWSVLPSLLVFFVVTTRRRNRLASPKAQQKRNKSR